MGYKWASPVYRATVLHPSSSPDPLTSPPETLDRYCHVYTWRTEKCVLAASDRAPCDGVGGNARAQIELWMRGIERGPRLCQYTK